MEYNPSAIETLRESLGITDLAAGEFIYQLLELGQTVSVESVQKAMNASAPKRVHAPQEAKQETDIERTTRILQQKYGK
ncbi:hypothetical protein FIV41_25860 [Pseudomonas marginalis]|uniref:Uncharacterized protein n=1 Tax=Pseudomonas marginalis TaxID=298 RepID=A0A9X9BMT1_PSEMA|nr:hypothetical protein [Pseudomonas marginalis]TWR52516.1 hypothetical protein FIV41_25860 [Pseudomonas marginalis]